MYITPCPKCGRLPKIEECMPIKTYKNGIRRRLISLPCFHSCVYDLSPWHDKTMKTWGFIWEGEGDDNVLFCEWNKRVEEVKNFTGYLPQNFIQEKLKGVH